MAKNNYDDGSTWYANYKKLWIQFMSVHTGRALKFKAFLTDFTDKFASNWNEENVYGRMDPIVTFQGTTRNLAFSFDVPSVGIDEGLENFAKLSLLISLLYPGYSGGSSTSISSAPLFKVKFSNWVDTGGLGKLQETGLVGAIKGIDFSPDLDQGVYDPSHELILKGGIGAITPKMFSVSVDMTVLHTDALGWDSNGNWRGNAFSSLGEVGGLQGGFPYGQPFPEQMEGVPRPAQAVTQNSSVGGSTDEMQQAAAEEVLDGGMSLDPSQAGAPMTSADAPQTVNYLDQENL